MNKLILFFTIFFTLSSWAEEEKSAENSITADLEASHYFNPRQNHWLASFDFEAMEYQVPFNYSGAKEDFKEDKTKLYGGRVGVGGEIYLGLGFSTSTRIEGYYMGTMFEEAKTAAPQVDVDAASVKTTGQIYGVDAVQTLGWVFDMKTKNPILEEWTYLYVQPYIEVGIGKAWGYNQKDYTYDTGPSGVVEEYDQSFNDELTNARIGGGISFTSRSGYFLYLRATQNRYDITRRRSQGYSYANGSSRPTENNLNGVIDNSKMDPVTIYALGGGYKW